MLQGSFRASDPWGQTGRVQDAWSPASLPSINGALHESNVWPTAAVRTVDLFKVICSVFIDLLAVLVPHADEPAGAAEPHRVGVSLFSPWTVIHAGKPSAGFLGLVALLR